MSNINLLNDYRQAKKATCITCGFGRSPFGEVFIAFFSQNIYLLEFVDDNKEQIFENFQKSWDNVVLCHDDKKALKYLENIFIKKKKYNLVVKGTNFQIDVWRALLNLPSGTTSTYQEIANSLNKPKAVRAVASAIGKNHIGYLIPCHRVISKSGAIGGYRWGIERKKLLLIHESRSSSDC